MPGSKSCARGAFLYVVMLAALAWARPAAADESPSRLATLYSNAVELGLQGSFTSTDGIVAGTLGIRGGMLFKGLHGLLGVELDVAYRHISSLDVYDLGIQGTWQRRLGETGNYPFVALGVGVRSEDIGSFRQTRYPVGFGVGLRTLFGQRAAIRVEYAFRRVLNDPISDFSEHRIVVGLSIFFRNSHPQP